MVAGHVLGVIKKAYLKRAFGNDSVAGEIDSGWEFVLVARTRILKVKSQDIAKLLYEFLEQEGITRKDA